MNRSLDNDDDDVTKMSSVLTDTCNAKSGGGGFLRLPSEAAKVKKVFRLDSRRRTNESHATRISRIIRVFEKLLLVVVVVVVALRSARGLPKKRRMDHSTENATSTSAAAASAAVVKPFSAFVAMYTMLMYDDDDIKRRCTQKVA